jgi:hypothetical protein
LVEKAERQIIAGHADAQRPAFDDQIQPRGLLGLRRGCSEKDQTDKARENAKHQAITLERGFIEPIDSPANPPEPGIDQLKERVAIAKDFVESIRPAQIDGTEEKEVIFTFRNGTTRKFTGRSLLLTFSVPQFFFHLTTAYDILRHCGVELAKRDFLAARRA